MKNNVEIWTLVITDHSYRGKYWENWENYEFEGTFEEAEREAASRIMYNSALRDWSDEVRIYPGSIRQYDYKDYGRFYSKPYYRLSQRRGCE